MRDPRHHARPWISTVLLGFLAAALFPWFAAESAQQPTLVFVVRHAEKAKDDPRDPSLSEAGRQRAEDLAQLLSTSEVTHLFSSQFRRTRQTLAPLAQQQELEVQVISAHDPDKQKEALLGLPPGSVAVVAGHSNTVPAMVQSLGGNLNGLLDTEHGDMLHGNEYDRLFLVILSAGDHGIRTLEMRYGD
jgi:phosphohistidine phosphatase SixA